MIRKILAHLPHSEVLRFSLVNKSWSLEAKTLLKMRGNVVATVGPAKRPGSDHQYEILKTDFNAARVEAGTHWSTQQSSTSRERRSACADLVSLAKIVECMSIVPFSSLNILVAAHAHPDGSCAALQPATIKTLGELVPMRRLRIIISSEDGMSCKAVHHFWSLLEACATQLEELLVFAPSDAAASAVFAQRKTRSPMTFPQLKILKFDANANHTEWPMRLRDPCKYTGKSEDFVILRDVIANVPKLEQLHLDKQNFDRWAQQILQIPEELTFRNTTAWMTGIVHQLLRERDNVVFVFPSIGQFLCQTLEFQASFKRFACRYIDYIPEDSYPNDFDIRVQSSRKIAESADFGILRLSSPLPDGVPKSEKTCLNTGFDTLERSIPRPSEFHPVRTSSVETVLS